MLAGMRCNNISEVTCEYWQVLGFVVCIGMYGGLYYGTYWHVLAWYVLWHVLVCIIFGKYWYVFRGHMCKYSYVLASPFFSLLGLEDLLEKFIKFNFI